MRLNQHSIQDTAWWRERGYALPEFDREAVARNTQERPKWIHFGAGNIFRAFPAAAHQALLNEGVEDTGIVVCEGFDEELIEKAYTPFDNLSLLVTLKTDGSIERTVVGSVVEALNAARGSADWTRLEAIFANPSLQMASFTITEKGYALTGADGNYAPAIERDFAAGPDGAQGLMGKLAALCLVRYRAGGYPISLVSMDNCSHNGDKLGSAVKTMATQWQKGGLVEQGFVDYVSNPAKVAFPWSMIDKITPRPDSAVQQMLAADGFEDGAVIRTAKNTFTSAFVNAEEAQYLVIEDAFPNGRPALDRAGIIFTERETVDKVEKMKVCTCLNPLHTALAIFGCLLNFDTISNEMKDADLKAMVEKIGYVEGMPVVVHPGIIDPRDFIREVLEVRLPNPFMPDTPQRIATDTSQKLSIRFGETVKAYQASNELDVASLKLIPLVFAGWLRYLMGVDDAGNAFEISSDPLLEQVRPAVEGIVLGDGKDHSKALSPILSNAKIFGVDLYAAGLAEKTLALFGKLCAGPGAVRKTLHEAVQ